MSVAGILASSLFANAVSQVAHKLSTAASPNTDAQSVFGALQQGLLAAGSNSSSGGTSVPATLSQVGKDLESGNLPAAQADFTAFKTTLAQYRTQMLLHSSTGQTSSGGNGSSSGASNQSCLFGSSSDPLAAAMLAYGSLQQGQSGGALNASVLPTANTFSITA